MGMEAKPTPAAISEDESALVQKITKLATAIGDLPSLHPSPEVNSLFTELVTACIPPSTIDVDTLGPEAQSMRRRLITLCADAEGHLESHYSDLLAAHDGDPLDHLEIFPYFGNYVKLSQLEHGLLSRHVSESFSRVAFLGSGPLPLSSLVLAARHLPDAAFVNYDISPDANARASRLVHADADADAGIGIGARMEFRTADVTDEAVAGEMGRYDVVFLAALVGMAAEEKARVVAHLGRHMAPGAALVVRSAHGARGFLYPVVDPEDVRKGGFEVLCVHHPEDEVINSVIIAQKKMLEVDDEGCVRAEKGSGIKGCAAAASENGSGMKGCAAAANGDVLCAAAAAVVSRPCLGCCEMEARAHRKLEEMAMDQELPS